MEANPECHRPREWRVASVSVAGKSHEKNGQPCQDAHRWRSLPGGVLVTAVADGAGSAHLGDIGANLAATTAIETICQHGNTFPPPEEEDVWEASLADALQASKAAVETEATARGIDPRDMATTLIVVVATPSLVAAAQVGDGAALVRDTSGNFVGLTRPPNGEYINETTFLTSPSAIETAQWNLWKGTASCLAVLSDGLQMIALKMPEGIPHAPFFTPLFNFLAAATDEHNVTNQLEAFLRAPRIAQRTDDDLTLVLAVFAPCDSR